MEKTKLYVGKRCPLCQEVVISLHRHDLRHCSCGSIFIDGGFDYCRIGFKTEIDPETIETVNVRMTDETSKDKNNETNASKGTRKGKKNEAS